MPGTTSNLKLPYPLSTDYIAQGASMIQQLAEGIDGHIALPDGSRGSGSVDYPVGTSLMRLTGAQASEDGGWASGAASMVITFFRSPATGQMLQLQVAHNSARQAIWYRTSLTVSSPGWREWQTLAAPVGSMPTAMAAGSVTVTPTAGASMPVTITFPSGRFQDIATGGALRPMLTAGGATRAQDIALCVYSVNPSSMLVYIYRTTATDTAIGWQVTQGLDRT